MTADELESLLEAGIETQSIDYKESCEWNIGAFAKDILAMSNVKDGGSIIIGVKEHQDGTYERIGIKPEHQKTYNRDKIMDKMKLYADPRVELVVSFPKDKKNLKYAVITVLPFKEIPVICLLQTPTTLAGVIYYRNRNRRIESAPVSNADDMRDIVERAAIKNMLHFQDLGLDLKKADRAISTTQESKSLKLFEEEREGI